MDHCSDPAIQVDNSRIHEIRNGGVPYAGIDGGVFLLSFSPVPFPSTPPLLLHLRHLPCPIPFLPFLSPPLTLEVGPSCTSHEHGGVPT